MKSTRRKCEAVAVGMKLWKMEHCVQLTYLQFQEMKKRGIQPKLAEVRRPRCMRRFGRRWGMYHAGFEAILKILVFSGGAVRRHREFYGCARGMEILRKSPLN